MSDAWAFALIGAAAAIIGGVVNGVFEFFYRWLAQPVLVVDYLCNSSNRVEVERKSGEQTISDIYIRPRIRNEGWSVAKGCRVFLIDIQRVLPGGGTTGTSYHDSMPLSWPLGEFSPRDIPAGVNFFVDMVKISKNKAGWNFGVQQLYNSHNDLLPYEGTYRLALLATAENSKPVRFMVDVSYNGDWHNLTAVPNWLGIGLPPVPNCLASSIGNENKKNLTDRSLHLNHHHPTGACFTPSHTDLGFSAHNFAIRDLTTHRWGDALALSVPNLRSYQQASLNAWRERKGRGVIVLPTGAGKTVVGIAAIALTKKPAICLVPTRILLEQWRERLLQQFRMPIGILGDGKQELAPAMVATF